MATVERENIGLLNDKLTVKLKKEDYLPAFEKKLKEYGKNANIPGFRKGMVPAGIIKKMYGQGVFSEEILRTIEKELYAYIDKERPDIFAQPLPMNGEMQKLDMNSPADIDFSFEIGLKPEYKIPDLSKASLTRYNADVTDAMVTEELSRMQIKGGTAKEKDTISGDDDTVKVRYTEADESGNAVAEGISKENESAVKYLSPKMKEQFAGKKAGDSFVFQLDKTFEGTDLENMLTDLELPKDDAEAAKKYFKAEIISVSEIQPRTLDEDFFNEIYPGRNMKTEEEVSTALKEEIKKYWDAQSRNQLHDQIYHLLLDETKMEFPQQFLTRWLKNGGDKERTQEEAEKEYPTFQNQLKWTLISDNIIRDNKLDVSEDELRTHMREEVSRYFGQMNMGEDMSWLDSYLNRMMKDEKQVDATYRRLVTEKLFDWAQAQASPAEKTVSSDELAAMQHHHTH